MADIFKLIKKRQWTELSAVLVTEDGKRLTERGNELGELPLHFALWVRAPDSIIEEFIKTHSKAVMMEDNDKWLPLHHAAFRDASSTVIEILILAYPSALDMHNNNGDTPRHLMNNNLRSCARSRELVAQPTQFWYDIVHNQYQQQQQQLSTPRDSPSVSVKTEKLSNQTSGTNLKSVATNANPNSMSLSFDTSSSSAVSLSHISTTSSLASSAVERRLEFLESSFQKSLIELEKVNQLNEKLFQQNKSLETRLESFESSTITNITELAEVIKSDSSVDEQLLMLQQNSQLQQQQQLAKTKRGEEEEEFICNIVRNIMQEEKDLLNKSITALSSSLTRVEDGFRTDIHIIQDETSKIKEALDLHNHCFDQKLILASKTLVEAFRTEMKTNLKPIRDNLFRLLCKVENNEVYSSEDSKSVVPAGDY